MKGGKGKKEKGGEWATRRKKGRKSERKGGEGK